MFTQFNQEYFQCAWGVQDFRQGAIVIAREFISPNMHSLLLMTSWLRVQTTACTLTTSIMAPSMALSLNLPTMS
jgi:hypothetical protein